MGEVAAGGAGGNGLAGLFGWIARAVSSVSSSSSTWIGFFLFIVPCLVGCFLCARGGGGVVSAASSGDISDDIAFAFANSSAKLLFIILVFFL